MTVIHIMDLTGPQASWTIPIGTVVVGFRVNAPMTFSLEADGYQFPIDENDPIQRSPDPSLAGKPFYFTGTGRVWLYASVPTT